MFRKLVKIILVAALAFVMAATVYANERDQLPVEITVENGIVSWEAVPGAGSYSIMFRWREHTHEVRVREPKVDLDWTFRRIVGNVSPGVFEMTALSNPS